MQMSMLAMLIQMETEVIITHLESPVDPVMAPQAGGVWLCDFANSDQNNYLVK